MENLIITRRRVLEAALSTVRYKIANLQPYFSREQIRCWYRERNAIVAKLKELPTIEQVKADAKRTTRMLNDQKEKFKQLNL